MDISEISLVQAAVHEYLPDTIINFAAHRNANTAESQRDNKRGSAWMTNVVGAENLSKVCRTYGIYLLHISSDLVFGGKEEKKGPYAENDIPENDPENLTWYGWTKRLAEQAVMTNSKNSCVVRIGNVSKPIYDPSLDYIGKIQWLFDTNNSYPLFFDQQITLTHIPELVNALVGLIDARLNGVIHMASDTVTTPVQVAEYLLRKTRPDKATIKQVSIDDYLKTHPNRYPKHGGLKSQVTQKVLGKNYMPWQGVVDYYIDHAT